MSPDPTPAFDLANPMHLRAEMARAGIAPMQNRPYEDPERGYVDPLDDDETRTTLRRFLAALWRACERAEGGPMSPDPALPTVEITQRGVEHSGCDYMALLFVGIENPDDRVWFCNKCGHGGVLDATQAAMAEMLRLTLSRLRIPSEDPQVPRREDGSIVWDLTLTEDPQ